MSRGWLDARRIGRKRIGRIAAGATALCCALALPAGASPQDDLRSARARAAALDAKIEAGNEEIAQLDEQFNLAQSKANAAADRIAAAKREFDATAARVTATQGRLAGRAATLYMRLGGSDPLPELNAANVNELGARAKYGEAAAARDTALLDAARVAQEDLKREEKNLERRRDAADTEARKVQAARQEVEAAVAEQQELLASVEGNIADLVHKISEEKRRADEARARAAMQAAQAAARPSGQSVGLSRGPSGTAPANLPAPSGAAATAVSVATQQLGKPYLYAGAGPDSFDCSGLTMYAWGKAGVSMAHSATLQYTSFPHVPMDQLQAGDLLVFGHPIHHVGMYVGNGTMIEAPHTGAFVRYASIYRRDYVGASRPG